MFSLFRSAPWVLLALSLTATAGLGVALKHSWQQTARAEAVRDQTRTALTQQEQVNERIREQARRDQQLLQARARAEQRIDQDRATLSHALQKASDASPAYRRCRAVRLPDSSLQRLRKAAPGGQSVAGDTAG